MFKILKRIFSSVLQRLSIVRLDINRNDRQGALAKAWGHVYTNSIVGDYVEFGVYKGDSVVSSLKIRKDFNLWLLSQHKSDEKWRRDFARNSPLNDSQIFHCLDTFEGMPDNDEGSIAFAKGSFFSKLSEVKAKIEKHNSENIKVKYYKGLFSETRIEFLKSIKSRNIAIANIDCDLEASTRDALNSINQNISIGTILLIDDYNSFKADNNKGQRKAFSDFQEKSEFIFEKFFHYMFVGQAFLVVGRK
tara:strand:+ start:478 stop:1221 length:744 start_codon:yes stop_codon:yes gene_type:complete